MEAINMLLTLRGKRLEAFLDCNKRIVVNYRNSWIKDGMFLLGVCGRGVTFNEACENYLQQIHGKILVFNAESENREEIRVL